MKLFNKNNMIKRKISEGKRFLAGLSKALQYNGDKEEYRQRFSAILNRADEKKYQGKGVKALNDSIRKSIKAKGLVPVTETKSTSDLIKQLDKLHEVNKQLDNDKSDFTLVAAINQAKGKDVLLTKKKSKFKLKIEKLKFKLKNTWALTKEFGRVIKGWAIAEYKIVRKLTYALNKKKEEVKIRKAFESNMTNFVNKYGYDVGMERYHRLVRGIQSGIHLDKRLVKIGR